MVFDQAIDRSFFYHLQVNDEFFGYFTQEVGIVIGERANKADRVVLIVVLADIACKEAA